MKHSSKISLVSVLCALCVCAGGSAYGAASVRSLGGAGTYSGTTSASSASASSSTGAARAGSVRVTPSSTKATTSTSTTVSTGNASAARGATTSRLSIGKYLSGGVKTDGSKLKPNISITSPGDTNISNEVTNISNEVTQIINALDALRSDVNDLRQDSHSIPGSRDGLVDIDPDKNELFLNLDALRDALSEKLEIDAGTIDIRLTGSDDNQYISFCQSNPNGECKYQEIIAVSELRGPKGDKGDSVSIDDLAVLLPQLEQVLSDKITAAIDGLNLGALATMNTVGTDQIDDGAVTEEKLSAELQEKINKDAVDIDLTGYVTTDEMNDALAFKQDALSNEQMAVLDSGITADAVAQIGLNAENITANAAAIAQKANADDVYTKSDTYSQAEIDQKLSNVTAGGVEAAPDGGDYAWVSIGNTQQWVSIAGAVNNE